MVLRIPRTWGGGNAFQMDGANMSERPDNPTRVTLGVLSLLLLLCGALTALYLALDSHSYAPGAAAAAATSVCALGVLGLAVSAWLAR